MEAMGIPPPPSGARAARFPAFPPNLIWALQLFWTSMLVNRGTRSVWTGDWVISVSAIGSVGWEEYPHGPRGRRLRASHQGLGRERDFDHNALAVTALIGRYCKLDNRSSPGKTENDEANRGHRGRGFSGIPLV
jgi:hypothetical protein